MMFAQRSVSMAVAGLFTTLMVWMFSAASAFSVVAG